MNNVVDPDENSLKIKLQKYGLKSVFALPIQKVKLFSQVRKIPIYRAFIFYYSYHSFIPIKYYIIQFEVHLLLVLIVSSKSIRIFLKNQGPLL